MGHVPSLDAVLEEDIIPQLLCPKLIPVDSGGRGRDLRACFLSPVEMTGVRRLDFPNLGRQCLPYVIHFPSSYIHSSVPEELSIFPRPELNTPLEGCNEVSSDHT